MLFTTATSIESWPRVEKIRSMMKKLIVRTFRETWRMRSVYPIASTKRRRAYKRFLSRIIPHRVHIPTTLPAHVIELRAPTAITMLLGTTVLLILGRRVTSISLSLSLLFQQVPRLQLHFRSQLSCTSAWFASWHQDTSRIRNCLLECASRIHIFSAVEKPYIV